MEPAEAREKLGISAEASAAEIDAAYLRLRNEVLTRARTARRARANWDLRQCRRDWLDLEEARGLLIDRESSPGQLNDESSNELDGGGAEWSEQIVIDDEPPDEADGGGIQGGEATGSVIPKTPMGDVPGGLLDANPAKSPGPAFAPMLAEPELKAGDIFGEHFKLLRSLGSEGEGRMWQADDRTKRRVVALQFLPEPILSDPGALADLKDIAERSTVLRHPNIARTFEWVKGGELVAVALENVDGKNLTQLRRLKPNRVFEVKDLRGWSCSLCAALTYAHEQMNFVHGGLQPNSMLVNVVGQLKLTGFGLAGRINHWLARLNSIVEGQGSSSDVALPLAEAEPTVSDDIYGVGATLYELLTGEPPFPRGNDLVGWEQPEIGVPSIIGRRAELGVSGEMIPESWEQTVAACLSRDPAQRPESAAKLAQRLQGRVDVQMAEEKPRKAVAEKGRQAEDQAKKRALQGNGDEAQWKRLLSCVLTSFGRRPWLVAGVLGLLALAWLKLFSPQDSILMVDSEPVQTATVLIDGKPRGVSPLKVGGLTPGDHQLRIERQGYQPQELVVSVKPGNQVTSQIIHLQSKASPTPVVTVTPSVPPEKPEIYLAQGEAFRNGTGGSKDLRKAFACYLLAAEAGLAAAQYHVGVAYARGEGVEQSDSAAVIWYKKAAEQGYAEAEYNLGVYYLLGNGVPKDVQAATDYWRKAAAQGNREAIDALLRRFAQDYLRRKQTGDLDRLVDDFYGEQVDYQQSGKVNRDHIRRDHVEYARRWPSRSYEITSGIEVRDTPEEHVKEVKFNYNFDVRNDAPNTSSHRIYGRAAETWRILFSDSRFLIVSERDDVLSRSIE